MTTWEETGKMLRRKNKKIVQEEPTTCVCGHSKYHHHMDGEDFVSCSLCEECPCYQDLILNPNV